MGTRLLRARELQSPVDRTLSLQFGLEKDGIAPARLLVEHDYARFPIEPLSPLPVLYLPSQIGCQGSCAFCSFGTWFSRSLSAVEVLDIANSALACAVERNCLKAGHPAERVRVIVSEMGDALYVPELTEAVAGLADRFHSVEVCTSCPAPENPGTPWQSIYEPWLQLAELRARLKFRASVHHSDNAVRMKKMAPGGASPMLGLSQIAELGKEYALRSGRPLWLNYMAVRDSVGERNVEELATQFRADSFAFVVSPYYPTRALGEDGIAASLRLVAEFSERLRGAGFAVNLDFSAGWAMGEGNGRHTGEPLTLIAPPPP